jgi:hypothetical protein
MMPTNAFPERHILDGFLAIEASLNEVLRHVPYCPAHEHVWSPILADCIIDACHQLDSLWKVTVKMSAPGRTDQNLNISDYFDMFGKSGVEGSIFGRWVVFWGEQPLQVRPFELWESGKYQKLPWWSAYTDLKHDRWQNVEKATLKEAVHATAALFLAILRCVHSRNAVAEAGWLSGRQTWESMSPIHSQNLQAWLGEDSAGQKTEFIAAESTLFSYPVGWWNQKIRTIDQWLGMSSHRFREWFDAFESK